MNINPKVSVFCGLTATVAFLCAATAEPQYTCVEQDGVEFCTDTAGKPVTGKITKYYDNGNYKSIINYKEGYPDGLATYFTGDGKLKERVYHKKGIKNGMDKIYYPNRTIKIDAHYKNGVLDNRQTFYTEEGKLRGQADYHNGKLTGGFCVKTTARGQKREDFSAEKIRNAEDNKLVECEE